MSSSHEYVGAPRTRTRRPVLLGCACFVVGTIVGGFAVWGARPHDNGAAVISALADGAPGATDPSVIMSSTISPMTSVARTTSAASPFPSEDLAGRCSAPESPHSAVTTIGEFRTLIVRTWMLCSRPSVFGSSDEIGLELLNDATWYKLYSDDDGTVARGAGFGRRGTWEILDTSGMNGRPTFQLNLSVFGSGTVISSPIFTAEPTKMRLNNMGLFVGDYVALN